MGQENSKHIIYSKFSRAIPPVAPQYGTNENKEWVDKGTNAFASDGDREQFIHGLISLTSSNGSLNLENHDIKLLFSRRQHALPTPPTPPPHQHQHQQQPHPQPSKPSWRDWKPASRPEEPDDGTRLVATLVAIDQTGVIRVKIEPEADGRTVAEAFRVFKKDVEIKLERLLRSVPSCVEGVGSGEAGAERVGPVPVVGRPQRELVDAPPAYGDVKR